MGTVSDKSTGHRLLQRLQGTRQGAALRLTDQQMNMLRHDDISGDVEAVLAACLLQRELETSLGMWRSQEWLPAITTEGHEVQVSSLLIPLQSPRHERRIYPST